MSYKQSECDCSKCGSYIHNYDDVYCESCYEKQVGEAAYRRMLYKARAITEVLDFEPEPVVVDCYGVILAGTGHFLVKTVPDLISAGAAKRTRKNAQSSFDTSDIISKAPFKQVPPPMLIKELSLNEECGERGFMRLITDDIGRIIGTVGNKFFDCLDNVTQYQFWWSGRDPGQLVAMQNGKFAGLCIGRRFDPEVGEQLPRKTYL